MVSMAPKRLRNAALDYTAKTKLRGRGSTEIASHENPQAIRFFIRSKKCWPGSNLRVFWKGIGTSVIQELPEVRGPNCHFVSVVLCLRKSLYVWCSRPAIAFYVCRWSELPALLFVTSKQATFPAQSCATSAGAASETALQQAACT